MPVTRRYQCDECDHTWTFLHLNRNEGFPDCPNCATPEPASLPTMFAITGVKSKAVDFAQKMAEETYGMTDMNDNMREGDVAAKAPPPVQGAEAEALTRAMKEMAPDLTDAQAEATKNFWQTGVSATTPQTMQQVAQPGAVAARQLGADPVEMLHKSEKAAEVQAGRVGPKMEVVGRSKMTVT